MESDALPASLALFLQLLDDSVEEIVDGVTMMVEGGRFEEKIALKFSG